MEESKVEEGFITEPRVPPASDTETKMEEGAIDEPPAVPSAGEVNSNRSDVMEESKLEEGIFISELCTKQEERTLNQKMKEQKVAFSEEAVAQGRYRVFTMKLENITKAVLTILFTPPPCTTLFLILKMAEDIFRNSFPFPWSQKCTTWMEMVSSTKLKL